MCVYVMVLMSLKTESKLNILKPQTEEFIYSNERTYLVD